MNWAVLKPFLFSYKGRVGRKVYNLYFLLPYTLIYLAFNMLDIAVGTYNPATGMGWISGVFWVVSLWPVLAVTTRRFHDRELSGWRQAAYFVVFIIGSVLAGLGVPTGNVKLIAAGALVTLIAMIVFIVEICFLKGTTGDNKFGPDPLKS